MAYSVSLAAHIVLGALAILLYWTTVQAVKGSPRHRRWGKVFLTVMVAVALSVGPLLFFRPGEFDPARVVQFVYLSLCVFTVVTVAWTAIRWKNDLARFRGFHFRMLGVTIFVLGLVVLFAGIASANPVPMVFSLIGLVYGAAMIRFAWMRSELHPRWWMGWHLNAVCGLFNAVHGFILAVAWRALVDPSAGDTATVVTELGTMLIAVAVRVWLGRKQNAPLRFSRGGTRGAAPRIA